MARAKRSVLVVEDDSATCSLLVALLNEHGFGAVAAHDAESGVRLARELRPSLITVNLALPDADGHTLLQRLMAHPSTRDIPVVVISAFTQVLPSGERKKLAYVLGKPFDVAEMLSVVEATVGNPYL